MKLRILGVALLLFAVIASPAWAVFCTACGAQPADDARFCGRCGKPLPGTAAVASAPESAPEQGDPAVASPSVLTAPPGPQAFQVTSKYLRVYEYQIYRNGLFWVAEISGGRARIWCLNEPPSYGIIMGWVSLAELEKRSTLKADSKIYCVEPPPPTAEVVVIRSRPYWRYWHPRPFFFSWHHRTRSRGHDDGHHRGH